jgi:hypothetical protein
MLTRLGVGEIELTQKMRHNIPKVEKEKSQTGWCHEAIRRREVSGFLLTVATGATTGLFSMRRFHHSWDFAAYSSVPNRSACTFFYFEKNSPLHCLISVCTFIDFEKKFPPTRLFGSH